MDKTVTIWISFSYYDGHWKAWVRDYIPSEDTRGGVNWYRVEIPVPKEEMGKEIMVQEPIKEKIE